MKINQKEFYKVFDIFENHNQETAYDLEEFAFASSDGSILDEPTRLLREYLKIDTVFTFDSGEELDFEESNHIKEIISNLRDVIYGSYDEDICYDYETLKKIIVLLDIYLDIDVSFYTTLETYMLNQNLEADLEILSLSNFRELYNLLNSSYRKGKK